MPGSLLGKLEWLEKIATARKKSDAFEIDPELSADASRLLAEITARPKRTIHEQIAELRAELSERIKSNETRDPALRLAVVCDAEGDPVPVAVAIRDKGACEVHIPAARFDPFALLDLLQRHGGAILH